MATLVFVKNGKKTRYPLDQERVVLGRHPDCDIQFRESLLSRHHLEIIRIGDEFVANDLESSNGSFLNNEPMSRGHTLRNDDTLSLARAVQVRFESDDPAHQRDRDRQFPLEISEDDSSMIMSSLESSSGFGPLESQPQVKLRAVVEISRSLVGSVDLEKLLPRLLDSLFRIFVDADRGCILLKDLETGEMRPAAQKLRRPGDDQTVKLSRTVVRRVLEDRTGILSYDARNDEIFKDAKSIDGLSIRSMMCVPLLGRNGEPIGLINIDTTQHDKHFRSDDLDLLLAIAGQAALSIENMWLMKVYAQKQKQDEEVRIAAQVQRALLPDVLPQPPGYEFFAAYEAAQTIGGDYYDALELPDQRICVAIGDVAGKGVPAALVVARLASCVQTSVQLTGDPSRAMAAVNRHMCDTTVEGRFGSLILMIVDPQQHEFQFANAGHLSPLVRHADGTVDDFDESESGLLVGIDPDETYRTRRSPFAPGDIVLLRTDGVDDAMNADGVPYGRRRVREFVSQCSGSPAHVGEALLAAVRQYVAGSDQYDDITLMSFGRLA